MTVAERAREIGVMFHNLNSAYLERAAKIIEAERRATITACLEQVESQRAVYLSNAAEYRSECAAKRSYEFAVATCERIATRLKQLEEQK